MRTLLVIAHPDRESLTWRVAHRLSQLVTERGQDSEVEIADLSGEGFDPRFGPADLESFRSGATPPDDVRSEQARIERSDALILLFPVHWWSVPAQLKGWIDRVFTDGWAYHDHGPSLGRPTALTGRPVHIVGVAAGGAAVFRKRGYDDAMRTQIDLGVFDYCSTEVVTSALLTIGDGDVDAQIERIAASVAGPSRAGG